VPDAFCSLVMYAVLMHPSAIRPRPMCFQSMVFRGLDQRPGRAKWTAENDVRPFNYELASARRLAHNYLVMVFRRRAIAYR